MKNIRLTILTTTYNRAHLLPQVFNSLQKQTVKAFEWLVIDDGSTDSTADYMQNLPVVEFPVQFHRKENGGKHTAMNYSHPFIHGEIVIIVDSDDYLVPDAVETILTDWQRYADKSNIGVLSYEKGGQNGKIISERADVPDYYVCDDIHFCVNHRVRGDRAEVVRTEIFKKFPLPAHENEKFMSEGWLWNNIAIKYRTVYIQKVIYICEYLDMGLTKSGRLLRMKSPLNMMENCKSFFQRETCIRVKMKELLLYCVYALCSDLSFKEKITSSNHPIKTLIMMPFGFLLYIYWRFKYSED
ncbi:glycosyltransferase family 2 protein [Selenomonas montiformis]|uniref:glycosyltransferase family 2 protein n=1 Tax=Selenomonas montiformis TaxID=2652285 RepID=UPI0039F5CA29